jgi:hypothetical protein
MIAVGDDHLELQRLEIAAGIGIVREAVEDGEESVRLAQAPGEVGGRRGHVDDADRRGRRLLRADERREAIETVVGDDGHADVRLLEDRGVRGHLRPGLCQRVEESGLARIRQADDPDLQRHRSVPEADSALTGEALRIQHPRQHEHDGALLRLERERAGGAPVQRLLELVGARAGNERAQDLASVEPDLNPHVSVVSHWTPPP